MGLELQMYCLNRAVLVSVLGMGLQMHCLTRAVLVSVLSAHGAPDALSKPRRFGVCFEHWHWAPDALSKPRRFGVCFGHWHGAQDGLSKPRCIFSVRVPARSGPAFRRCLCDLRMCSGLERANATCFRKAPSPSARRKPMIPMGVREQR